MRERRDERREPDVLKITRNPPQGQVRDIVHNNAAAGRPYVPMRRHSSASRTPRIPGPFWTRQRPDERREVDVLRKRKFESFSEVRDIIHGEGAGGVQGRDDVGARRRSLDYSRRRPIATHSGTRIPGPFWLRQRPDERREVDVLRRRKFEIYNEAPDVIHGEGTSRGTRDEGGRRHPLDIPRKCRPSSSSRIPGPFWMRQRGDAMREPDVGMKRKFPSTAEVKDVIHGEEARAREWQAMRDRPPPINLYDLPPGPSHADPFWLLERPDERREPDFLRRKKSGVKTIEAASVVHGEDFRDRWYPRVLEEDAMSEPPLPPRGYDDQDDDDTDEEPYAHKRECRCAPKHVDRGLDDWVARQDYGEPSGWDDYPYGVEEAIREVPAARMSCPPQAQVSSYDQPNTFMRKLYQKYPYLYQVLTETPPDELVSRVFKDRFLSTYQVDFLHMGVGSHTPSQPARGDPYESYTGPDGEPEPTLIPGCSYRHSQKGDFGRKKVELKKKEDKQEEEEAPLQVEKDGPDISEYMATISKLGGEIVQDQLYRVAQITKKMKNQYKNM